MHAIVHAADIQDRDGGVLLMATLFGLYPFLLKLYADGGYQGAGFQGALRNILKRVNVEIVKRSDRARASSSCRNAGSSSEPSLGSGAAEGWPRIGNVSTARRSPSSSSHPFASCCESYAIQDNVPGQTFKITLARDWR